MHLVITPMWLLFIERLYNSESEAGSIPSTDLIQQCCHKPASSASDPSMTLCIKKSFFISPDLGRGSLLIIAPDKYK